MRFYHIKTTLNNFSRKKKIMIILILVIVCSVYSFSCNGTLSTDADVCNGGGLCWSQDICTCYSGRKGTFCADYVQNLAWPYDLSGNSVCTPVGGGGVDACSGNYPVEGVRHGLCVPGENHCFCTGNSLGTFCDYYQCGNRHISNPQVCSNHGTCYREYLETDPSNTVLDTPCVCAANYSGLNCEQTICFGVVGPTACHSLYRGRCLSKDVCTCNPGFYGDRCQWKDCPAEWGYPANVCGEHGHCTDTSTGSEYSEIYCVCNRGYTGQYCERCARGWGGVNCSELDCSALDGGYLRCNGHGYCLDYQECHCYGNWAGPNCTFCLPGYVGSNCSEIICAVNGTNCTNHGVCNGPDTCLCSPQWTDSNCDKCIRGYQGTSCSVFDCSPTSPECSGHGSCLDNITCGCDTGYTGIYCQFPPHVPDCSTPLLMTSCNGHGTCINVIPLGDRCNCTDIWDGEYCTRCKAGYAGQNCTGFECHTTKNGTVDCNGHGNCIGPKVCNCTKHFTGKFCEICIPGYDDCIVPVTPVFNLAKDQAVATWLFVGLIITGIIILCLIAFGGILLYQKLVVYAK